VAICDGFGTFDEVAARKVRRVPHGFTERYTMKNQNKQSTGQPSTQQPPVITKPKGVPDGGLWFAPQAAIDATKSKSDVVKSDKEHDHATASPTSS
jgi:hypothetical protein